MIAELIISALILTTNIQKEIKPMVNNPTSITTIDGRNIELTADDISLIQRVTSAEGKGESIECQTAIATVVLNRLASPDYPDTVAGVVYQQNQFVIDPADKVPTNTKMAVLCAITLYNSDKQILPHCAYYFRAGKYHNFGIPLTKINNTYFSTSENVLL